jgi:hypothetical protein
VCYERSGKKKGLETATPGTDLALRRLYFQDGNAWGYCLKNPCKGVQLADVEHKQKKPFTLAEVQGAMNECNGAGGRLVIYTPAGVGRRWVHGWVGD